MNLLSNKEFHVEGGWYEPRKYLKDTFKSVIHSGLLDTTSSAGDWNGYFIQHRGKDRMKYVIRFSQVNNYPNSGFTLYTDEVVWQVDAKMTIIEIEKELTKTRE